MVAGRRRRLALLGTYLVIFAMLVTGLPALPAAPGAALARAAVGDAVDILTPLRLVHANGAELEWSRYTGPSGAPFDRYEVHRSTTAGFTPSAATLLTTIRDRDVTAWRDTTAAPAKTFSYKVVANSSPSVEVAAATPASGQATLTLQPDARLGTATYVVRDRTTPVDCYDWYNYGAATNLRIGTAANGVVHRPLLRFDLRDVPAKATVASATLTLAWPASTAPTGLPNRGVNLHRVTRAWGEGTGVYPGQCNGSGAGWNETQGGLRWAAGGDIDATADVTTAPKARSTVGASGFGTDAFNVLALVREWVNGEAPNHGMLLKLADDATIPADNPYFDYHSDDAATPAARPSLKVTYTDGSTSLGPRTAVAAPGPGATVGGGAVKLAAAAGDDRRVDKVDFLVEGAAVGTDSAPPFEMSWNSTTVAAGQHPVTVRATDDAGNVTTSSPVNVTVDNGAAPTGALTAPAQGAVVRGTGVTLSATASDDVAVKEVEFLVDGVRVGTPDTTATSGTYSIAWNTLHPLTTAFDGGHEIRAYVTDTSGRGFLTPPRTVTVDNRAASQYRADLRLNDPATTTDDVVPQLMTESATSTASANDPYGGTINPDGTSGGSLGKSLTSAPVESTLTGAAAEPGLIDPAPEPCPADAYCPTVTVTNASGVDWKNNTGLDLRVWYRWYASNGAVLFEGPAFDNFPNNFQSGATKTFPLTIPPPRLPPGAELGEYRLRIDLYDVPTASWFSGRGNQPIDNPVLVVKNLEEKLGLERFWHYDGEDVGAGMSTLTNVANGNMLLRWSPFFIPGRGLATMVDLTYNSLEDHSESPAGENFSLAISGLTRLGAPLDIHPNKADQISGKSNKWVEFIDGDGTTHRFTGTTLTDGSTRWTEPAGVNLYLRSVAANPPDRRWALTRPDNVTFYFDVDGFPTAVVDRNGNTITYVLEDTQPGEDPGGPKKRVTRVVAPSTPGAPDRQVTVDYWSKDEARKAHVRGKIQRITDHTGSALDFDYYDDGNLLRLTQRGGAKANGEHLADRSFTFTYTTSAGDGPAIADFTARGNPDPRTPNQSTRIYGVRDPRGNETSFSYFRANEAAQLRWKVKSRTNRGGNTAANRALTPNPYATTFAYDIVNRVTTVTAPPLTAPRATRFAYDTDGKVVRLTNAKNETTQVVWSPDFKVTQVTEPTGRFTTYAYNANGYPTAQTNQLSQRTELTYLDQQVDAADTGRHLSLLSTVTSPKGVASPTVGDFQWRFAYDAAGNPDKVTDPSGAVTDYDYNLAGSAAPGTLAVIRDAKGNPPTTFPAYDFSGQASEIVDPLGNRTRLGYDGDGLLRWIQDANHATATGADERSYKSFLDYDAFHRLGRQSAPKSTSTARGTLIWSSVDFDANDNVVRRVEPHFGSAVDDGGGGAAGSATFDEMDLPLLVATSDASVDAAGERTAFEYDTAGRLVKTTRPKGVLTGTADDYATVYAYDTLDRQLRRTDFGATTADKRTTHLCYDLAGDLRSVTSPRAGLDTVACPGTGPLTGTGFTATFTYNAAHRLVAQADPLGHERRIGYDANGNTTSQEADIDGGRATRVVIDYDPRNLPVMITQRFDGATGRNAVNRIEYDANGNRSRLISARAGDASPGGPFVNYVTALQYDAIDRLATVTLPFDGRDGAERRFVHHAYDPNGNLLSTSLPVTTSSPGAVQASAKRSMTYFDPGWVRTSDDPTNPKVHFDYAAPGWQTRQVPERKDSPGTLDTDRTMTWEYFNDAELKERKDSGGHPSTYTYDADNNLTRALDAAGVTDPGDAPMETEATYTGFDEVAKVRHRRRTASTWTFSDYVYDANGNVTVRRENGEEDTAGSQTKAPRRHELTYDQADWLSRQLDLGTDGACADDQRIENLFWSTGWERKRDVYRAGTGCSGDPLTWPRKQTTTWDHFDNGKLRTLVTRNGSDNVTESHEVGYLDDAGVYVNGNRTSDHYVLERSAGHGATTCRVASPCDAKFVYDARDKLLRHQQRAGKETVYTLDEPDKLLGDKTVRGGNVTTETKNGQSTVRKYTGDQLTELSVGGVVGKYWYDQLGNLDCITLAAGTQANCSPSDGGASANLVTDFAYDYLNRLAGTRSFSGGSTRTDRSDYTYDALDRVTKEVEDHAGSGNDRTTTMTHQGLSNLVTEEKQAGGTSPKTKSFSYDAYGHQMAMTSTDNGTGAAETFTFGHDVHGSVSQLISDTGTVRASYGYDAYGGSDAPSSDPEALTTGDTDNQAPLNPYRYSGKRLDSGLATGSGSAAGYDMGTRRFGPDTTQFIQQDMFASALGDLGLSLDPLTQNRYALAGGNPISYVETDGHMVIADGGGGGSPAPNPDAVDAATGDDGYRDPTSFWVDSYRSISEQKSFPRSQLVARIRQDYVEGIKTIRAQAIARAKSSGDWEAAARWGVEQRNQLKHRLRDQTPIIQRALPKIRGEADTPSYQWLVDKQVRRGTPADQIDERIVNHLDHHNQGYTRFTKISRWAGRAGLGLDVAFGGYNIATAKPEDRAEVIGGEAGRAAGAWGGRIAGAALAGAALGSVVPGAGTAVGAAVGVVAGIAGAVGGGWAGEKVGSWIGGKLEDLF
jgi:RHS repeat-associated protein